MSGDANSCSENPFAGYTPVESGIRVVDDDIPEFPRPVRHRSKRKKNDRTVLRTIGRTLLGFLSVALIVVIAAATYGFIYGYPTSDMTSECVAVLNRMRPLVDFGRNARDRIRGVMVLKSTGSAEDRRLHKADSSPNMLTSVTNVVVHKKWMNVAQDIADGHSENVMKPVYPVGDVQLKCLHGKLGVDSRIKKFRTGGRTGRSLR